MHLIHGKELQILSKTSYGPLPIEMNYGSASSMVAGSLILVAVPWGNGVILVL